MNKIGSQLGKWAHLWTPEEDERVRRAWAAPKTYKDQMGMFPGRTWEAVRAHAKELGLGPKPQRSIRGESPATSVVIDLMCATNRPMTVGQIVSATRVADRTVREILKKGHGTTFHVANYVRFGKSRIWQAKWSFGEGDDAAKPKPLSSSEARRNWRARQRQKVNVGNPFAVAMNQVIREAA
jgi:hypothetical protein